MLVEPTTEAPLCTNADTIVIGVFEGEEVAHDVGDEVLGALLASGEARRDFKHLAVTHADGRRLILIGLGAREQFDSERARVAAAVAEGRARELATRVLCWEVPHHVGDEVIAGLVEGTLLHAYRFERYKAAPDGEAPAERTILSAHHEIAAAVGTAATIVAAQNRARDLANTPANDLTPERLAAYAQRLAGVSVESWDEDEIGRAGMGAFAAVARGSLESARLIRLQYDGRPGGPQLGLIGKAVTFDSGGLSLKPAASMQEMKFDMAGGAAVIEAIAALAQLGAPVRALGVVGATENMPSGNAVKPGDIVRALDGTTIEVNNTDAEGRLVLADCISYARREGCARLIDIATLTGGIVVALGSTYSGLMCNDDRWAEQVTASATAAGELVWRMPLHPQYADMIKGRYAQIVNATERREATAITAAEFLHHFAGDTPWAHIDIAGGAYDARRPYFDKGATGFGVRLLVEAALRAG
ncbi:MAG: leucyl aminopeptidase [Solirubrobacteraceae bacterium]|jgi:leucyl aminopeptidase